MKAWPRGALFAGYYWLSGRRSLLASVDRLDRLHFAPREEIDVQVRRNLAQLLTHAAQTVPYYRDRLEGQTITESTVLSVLQTLPILTKDTIRRETQRLISDRPGKKPTWNTSGGSTGEPIRLLQDRRMDGLRAANKLLFMRWGSFRIGEPHVLIWGVPKETFGEKISLHEKVYRAVHNQTFLNCYGIDDDLMGEWVRRINATRPTLIEAYADALYELSQYVARENLRVAAPRAIVTSAGVLTTHMREVITKAFGCPILNRYGSREVSDMACSCPSSPELHVNESSCHMEIVDDEGQPCPAGVEGNILVTLYTNYTMPLIRYRIEDRGVWASRPCACGRNSRRLAAVCGRQSDFILATDGTKINGTALTTLLYSVEGIRRFQYRQASGNRVVLAVAPLQGISVEKLKKDLAVQVERLKQMLKGAVVDLTIADDIIPSKSGKFRYIVNDLADARLSSN